MLRNADKTVWIAGALVLCWGAAAFLYFGKKKSDKTPSVTLWSDRNDFTDQEYREMSQLHDELSDLKFDEFSVDDLPFSEALARFTAKRDSESSGMPISFEFDDEVDLSQTVSMSVVDISAIATLWVLASRNDCRTHVRPGFSVSIEPSNADDRDEVGWFAPNPLLVESLAITGKGKVDARAQLETRGIEFRDNDFAEYDFATGLLKVETTRQQLEEIELIFDSFLVCYQPTWRDWLAEWWNRVTHRALAVPVAAPPSVSPGAPSASSGAPDPFGGSP